MKFNEDQLNRLHKAVKNLNSLDLGQWNLPERFGLHNKDGEVEALIVLDQYGKYTIELINQNDITQQHDEEVRKTEETDDRHKQI